MDGIFYIIDIFHLAMYLVGVLAFLFIRVLLIIDI